MFRSRKKVLEALQTIRPGAGDYFVELGKKDKSTQSKQDISNQMGNMSKYIPLVKAFVKAAKKYPVYVGYDGEDLDDRSASYVPNIILLHEIADDSPLSFIIGYTHELTHMDQDRRNLLRAEDPAPPPEKFLDFLLHNLCLEAAALATEVTCIYYLSAHSRLRKKVPELAEFFYEYTEITEGRNELYGHVQNTMKDADVKDFNDLKPVWRAVFQAFFDPDSEFLATYLKDFCEQYLRRQAHNKEEKINPSQKTWGGIDNLRHITTLPGWGKMFESEGLDILDKTIRAAVLQRKNLDIIDLTRGRGQEPTTKDIENFMSLKRTP